MLPQIIFLLGIVVLFVVTALPLYLAVKMLGGETTILRTVLVMILTGFLVSLSHSLGGIYGGFIAFIVTLWLYRIVFRLGWVRALLVWAGQFVIVVLFYLLMLAILGTAMMTSLAI